MAAKGGHNVALLKQLHIGSNDQLALIFVHGLAGDMIDTWRHDATSRDDCWPHWLGYDTGCDVWTVAYDANLSAWLGEAMPLPDQGDQVADLLAAEQGLKDRSLLLIGHSMGGLVIKTMIISGRTKGDRRIKAVVDRICGVVFIATPHTGSELAKLANAVRWILRTNEQVENLREHDSHLRILNQQFRNAVHEMSLPVRIFAERQGVPVGWQICGIRIFIGRRIVVVNPDSSDPGLYGVTAVPLASDHLNICKPAGRDQQIHKSVCDFVESVSKRQTSVRLELRAVALLESAGPPGRLLGAKDNRLQPRERLVCGRDTEVAAVVAFLRGSDDSVVVSAHVTGVGGAGKTEVCKAALKAWMQECPNAVAYIVEVPDRANEEELIYRIGWALGFKGIDTLDQLLAAMPPALYYLDNLESVAEEAKGVEVLRALKSKPGIRVLASSRVGLSGLFGPPIDIGALPAAAALQLFREIWTGPGAIPEGSELAKFVDDRLGYHALTIALVARLGESYSFPELVRRWTLVGTALAQDQVDRSRLGSLPVSLYLTAEVLARHNGALALWTVVALFPSGVPKDVLIHMEEAGGWAEARRWLVHHHLLVRRGEHWHMLPPVGRYALDMSLVAEAGFDWIACRGALQSLLGSVARQADHIDSTVESLAAWRWFLDYFNTWGNFIRQDLASTAPDLNWLQTMLEVTRSLYQFRPVIARDILESLSLRLVRPALAMYLRGELERHLGRPDQARALFECALQLYESERSAVGQANTLQALGDLEFVLGRIDVARALFTRALGLFDVAQSRLGSANTLRSLGTLELSRGRPEEARKLYVEALARYESELSGLGQANILQSLGDLARLSGQLDDARGFYDRALALYQSVQDGLGQANTHRSLGDLERRLGRPDGARKAYGEALSLYEAEQTTLGQANTLLSLGRLDSRSGRDDEVRKLFDRAMKLFMQEQDKKGQAATLLSLGNLELGLGRLVEARELFDRALALYESAQDELGRADTLYFLSDLELRLGRLDDARKLIDTTLKAYEAQQGKLGQANSIKLLGDLELRLGRLDEARKLYQRALGLFEVEQDQAGQARTLGGLGDVERRLRHLENAHTFYRGALKLYEALQDLAGEAITLKALGDMERLLGRLDQARESQSRALRLFEELQDRLGQANALQALGDLERQAGRPSNARVLYERTLVLYEQEPLGIVGTAYTYAELARCHHALNDLPKRNEALEKALHATERARVEEVSSYVMALLAEMTGGIEAATAWLRQRGMGG